MTQISAWTRRPVPVFTPVFTQTHPREAGAYATGAAPALRNNMMIRFLLIASGALFLGAAGAFFLFVPLLSLATVVCILGGLIVMFGLGVQFGTPALASDRTQPLDHMRLLPVTAPSFVHDLNARIKRLFGF